MFGEIPLIVFVVLIAIGTYIYKSIVVVPHGSSCVLERLGKYSRVLKSGVHILTPFESYRKIDWEYVTEDDKGQSKTTKNKSNYLVYTVEQKLDSLPVKCNTKDRYNVTVNGTLTYRISDVKVAIYKMENVMGFLCDWVVQATRSVVYKYEMADIRDKVVASDIVAVINNECADKGIDIVNFLIQNITYTDSFIAENRERVQQADFDRLIRQQEHENERTKINNEIELQELDEKKNMAAVRAKLERAQIKSDTKIAKEVKLIQALSGVGVTPEMIYNLKVEIAKSDIYSTFKGQTLVVGGDSRIPRLDLS